MIPRTAPRWVARSRLVLPPGGLSASHSFLPLALLPRDLPSFLFAVASLPTRPVLGVRLSPLF